MGKWLIYATKAAYQRAHHGRSPADDGITEERFHRKDGSTLSGYRVWDGPEDVWVWAPEEVARRVGTSVERTVPASSMTDP